MEEPMQPSQLTDEQLIAAYNALPDGEQGKDAEVILAEIERRNLDL